MESPQFEQYNVMPLQRQVLSDLDSLENSDKKTVPALNMKYLRTEEDEENSPINKLQDELAQKSKQVRELMASNQ